MLEAVAAVVLFFAMLLPGFNVVIGAIAGLVMGGIGLAILLACVGAIITWTLHSLSVKHRRQIAKARAMRPYDFD